MKRLLACLAVIGLSLGFTGAGFLRAKDADSSTSEIWPIAIVAFLLLVAVLTWVFWYYLGPKK